MPLALLLIGPSVPARAAGGLTIGLPELEHPSLAAKGPVG
ncbi:hypothetical protein HOE425_332256 [Hoeflea sp. EC-HK425]|nr:hypothetical protein HOE425_332256 [Hoeflea sp. EC-HK425]